MKVRIIKYVTLICKVNALRQKLVIPHFFTKAIRFLVQPKYQFNCLIFVKNNSVKCEKINFSILMF